MKRDIASLTDRSFDVLVIGAGVLGACAAWDAALRGLSVALIDAGDFASGTSSNSLKIVHGGLRYLQHLDLRRMRQSIGERSMWLRIAPHLAEPLPILVPTYGYGMESRLVLRTALLVNDVISADRNRGLAPDRRLPAGRAVSRRECLELAPELEATRPTGGVMFYDAQWFNSERLVLEIVQAAQEAGAAAVNHTAFEALVGRNAEGVSVRLHDRLSDDRLTVRSRTVINAAGPRVAEVAAELTGRPGAADVHYSVAMNLMFKGLGHRVAFSFAGAAADATAVVRRGRRQLFIVPWRGRSVIGTAHFPLQGEPGRFAPSESQIGEFLAEINGGWPGRPFRREEIALVHAGLLPDEPKGGVDTVRLLKHPRIIDHAPEGAPGIISAASVKYTTGRWLAERTVDLACRRLGRPAAPCRTAVTPLPGARFESLAALRAAAQREAGGDLGAAALEVLVRTYGARYREILAYRDSLPGWNAPILDGEPVIRAQLVHGVRQEMARTPDDLICRRTDLGARGLATPEARRMAEQILEAEAVAAAGARAGETIQ